MAQETWSGMVPCFWGHMIPAVEVGRTVSPVVAEAGGKGAGLLLLMGTHASQEAGPTDRTDDLNRD